MELYKRVFSSEHTISSLLCPYLHFDGKKEIVSGFPSSTICC